MTSFWSCLSHPNDSFLAFQNKEKKPQRWHRTPHADRVAVLEEFWCEHKLQRKKKLLLSRNPCHFVAVAPLMFVFNQSSLYLTLIWSVCVSCFMYNRPCICLLLKRISFKALALQGLDNETQTFEFGFLSLQIQE